ncbi:MAG: translation initiation factor IF-3 [Actinobacteria bacterium QS_5_72_10]|jgi:translation initiation factor IF-3|nr:MAG: translation initiation factor IF-3 [Actinobacteria bacterium QS_8_72_14]PSO50629.1 MAG: translation initiation factor IF-3 [Actinobacteria bacterium QS_5_72_10]
MPDRPAVNTEIRAKEVRLIGPEGKQVGIVPLKVAIEAAQALDLDLVEVSPTADPPVAKVMDYGKHVYEQERAEREARKQQRSTGQKAIRLRPKIDDHDIEVKQRQARKFLQDGHSVRVQVMFRRREMRRPEMGVQLLDRFAEELSDVSNVESRSPMEGRFATMVLSPKKSDQRSKKGSKSKSGAEATE